MSLNVVIFSGGIGGSKLVQGFYLNESFESLTVIGNTGDDVEMHGLWISPDLDIVMYTLAELVDEMKGWGRSDETFDCMAAMGKLGEKTWFNLGDKDLAVHIIRTKMMLAAGYEPDAAGVADYYKGLIDAIVIDKEDRERSARLELDGLRVKVTDTIMNSKGDKKRLAEELIKFVI